MANRAGTMGQCLLMWMVGKQCACFFYVKWDQIEN